MYGNKYHPPDPKTKASKFFWYVVFPSFIVSLTIAAIIETGLKFFGYHAELTPIFFIVFLIIFFILLFFHLNNTLRKSNETTDAILKDNNNQENKINGDQELIGTNKPLVKYPITDMSKEKKEKEDILVKNCITIYSNNYVTGLQFNDKIQNTFSENNIFFVLEMHTFIYWLTIYHMQKNNVNNSIIAHLMAITWDAITKTWKNLNLSLDEIKNYQKDRTTNYNKILNINGSLNEGFYNTVIDYLTQLTSEIIKHGRLSFFNPFPENIAYATPIHLDIMLIYKVKTIIQNFIVEDILPITIEMKKHFCDDIFYRDEK